MTASKPKVLLTDYAWPDLDIERATFDRAGLDLIVAAAEPPSPAVVEQCAAMHRPQAIMTNWAKVTRRAIDACPDLSLIARLGVGLDNIDVDEATRRGIWVTNVPDYCVEEVSDHAVALILAWARGIVTFAREVKAGRWQPSSARLHRVGDLTAGIVGYGRIGRMTARKLHGFGMRILAHDPYARPDDIATLTELNALLSGSDVIVLNVPATATTRHLIDAARLSNFKRGAFLVNVSRGSVVDTDALVEALERGQLGGAGLDVLEGEPDVPDALRQRDDTIITPHIAFSSAASLRELRTRACEEVVRVLRNERPRNPCNEPART